MKFCIYCGRQLDANGMCTCAGFRANMQKMKAPQQMPYESNVQYPAGSGFAASFRNYLVKSIVAPGQAIEEALQDNHIAAPVLLLGIHLFVILLTVQIHFPAVRTALGDAASYIPFGFRVLLAVAFCLTALCNRVITAGVLLANSRSRGYSFERLFAAVSAAAVPSTICMLLGFLFGFVSWQPAVFFLFIAYIYFVITTAMTAQITMDAAYDKKIQMSMLAVFAASMCGLIFLGIFGIIMVQAAMSTAAGYLGSLGSMFG